MPAAPYRRARRSPPPGPEVDVHLFGRVLWEDMANLQRRLAYEAASRSDGRIALLLCEHESVITIGRGGSRADIRFDDEDLVRRQIEVHYVSRGGGVVLHGPGQLAVYVIAPIGRLGWSGEVCRKVRGELIARRRMGSQRRHAILSRNRRSGSRLAATVAGR